MRGTRMKPRLDALDDDFDRDLYFLIARAYGYNEESLRRLESSGDPQEVFAAIDEAFDRCLGAIVELTDEEIEMFS